jgi:preprotein translocase subunit YajC
MVVFSIGFLVDKNKFKEFKMKKRSLVLLVLFVVLVVFSSCTQVGPPVGQDSAISIPVSNAGTSQVASAASQATSAVASGTSSIPAAGGNASLIAQLGTFLPIIAVFVVFYFFMMRPQKKKEKETERMRKDVQIGDEIVTIGGVVGKIVSIKDEDQLIIETGSDKTRIRIKRWAIQNKNTISG